ncbi:MAG: ATP-dependent RNA helicase HrpA [Phycisphaerales bacterium]|nr:MAG: ATP-dependent RNA helicase HrpA [Phycisphaerales bacterium]
MLIDQPRLRRRLKRMAKDAPASQVESLRRAIEQSRQRRSKRAQRKPVLRYPEELPVVQKRDVIAETIANHQVVVICGETGSGKTTQLPKICLELGRGVAGLIGHTQPRRFAARSVAARIAEEMDTRLGDMVGYKVRFGETLSERSLVKLMTDGILLNETRSDRRLLQYDTIIIDEAHERGLNIDFLLGYLKQLLPRRPDLKVIITSATIDPERFSKHFDDAPIVEVSGRTYPVEVRYRPLITDDPDEEDRDLERGVVEAVEEIFDEGPGDILVFVTGEREIRELREVLRRRFPEPQTEVLPLFARLSPKEQNRIFEPHRNRRIVLSTNVAETSLTVPGIRAVIDTGRVRLSRYSSRSGVQRLPIEAISQASAEQRKGRCGRIGPGICIRLYGEEDYEQREPYTPPEIVRTNLASVILQMKSLKLGEIDDFPFVEPPRSGLISDGYRTLHELNALTEDGAVTPIGEELARLPLDPRLGRMILAASDFGCAEEVIIIASALAVQDPRVRPHEAQDAADEAHETFADPKSDFLSLLNLWRFLSEKSGELNQNRMRKLCAQRFVSYRRWREWEDTVRQVREMLEESDWTPDAARQIEDEFETVHRAILTGLLSRIGAKGNSHEYTGAHGRKFFIFPGSAVFKTAPKWIMAAELIETTRLYAHEIGQIQPAWIEHAAQHLVKRHHRDPQYREKRGDVGAIERVTLFGLEIADGKRVNFGPIDPVAAREIFIEHALVEAKYRPNAPFLKHNRKTIESIRELEHKTRRRGILVDASVIWSFYDERLPKDVWSGSRLDRWRKQVERDDPKHLFMTREALLAIAAPHITPEQYPESLQIGEVELPLVYRFEPGHEEDGITLRVPAAMLGQLDANRLEWLVPAHLPEKMTALIKTLPKGVRRNFVPAAKYAAMVLERLEFGRGSLREAIARELHRMTGVEVPSDAWRPEELPPELHMNLCVLDDDGRVLAMGRDLRTLRAKLDVREHPAEANGRPSPRESIEKSGLTRWNFGDLPERIEIERAGMRIPAYPALVDHFSSVSIELFDTPEAARRSTQKGLVRLIALEHPQEFRYLRDEMPGFERIAMLATGLLRESNDDLRDAVARRVLAATFLADEADLRDEKVFRARLQSGWHQFETVTRDVAALARRIIEQFHEAAATLESLRGPAHGPIVESEQQHLYELLAPGFFADVPLNWLVQYPRYGRGILIRAQKAALGRTARDQELAAQVEPFVRQYRDARERAARQGVISAELDTLRWMIEEFRLSLFAQEIGTVIKVSARRLEDHFARLPV